MPPLRSRPTLFAVALLAALAMLFGLGAYRYSQTSAMLNAEERIRVALDELSGPGALPDDDLALLACAVSGDRAPLTASWDRRLQWQAALDRLDTLVSSDPTQHALIARLRAQVEAWRAQVLEPLTTRCDDPGRAGRLSGEQTASVIRIAAEHRSAIRALLDEFAALERDRRKVSVDTAWRWQLALGAACLVLLVSAAVIAITRFVAKIERSDRDHLDERALRRAAEAKYQASERRTIDFFESMTDGVLVIDAHGRVTFINRAAGRLFLVEPGSGDGYDLSAYVVTRGAPPNARGTGVVRQALNGPGMITGIEGIRSDGTRFPVELSVAECEIDARRALACVVRDITERERVERAKNEFLALVSHELRTPISSMHAALGALNEGFAGRLSDDALQMIDIAYRNCERLTVLVNDIIDIERLSSERMTIDLAPFDLHQALRDAIAALRGGDPARGVRIDLRVEPGAAQVLADRSRTLQVISNLIANALKFSPENSVIDVDCARRRETWRVAVRDRGEGVPEAFRARLFERFEQADPSNRRVRGGSGLGLSIARGLVERMGGQIGYEAAEDGGSTFWFELPSFRNAKKSGSLAQMEERP